MPPRLRTQQELMFQQLSPRDFERLCLAVVAEEGYVDVQHIGAAGNDRGVDISAHRDGRRIAFQCKRVRSFRPAAARKAVEKVLRSNHENPPDEIILITACDFPDPARREAVAAAPALSVRCWGLTDLERAVLRHPRLLDQFFDLPGNPRRREDEAFRCMAPAPEPFVERSEYASVRDALLPPESTGGTARAKTVGITTALHGAGGFGKTALAIKLCYDERVRERYPDGILWAPLSEEIDDAGRLARVRDLIRFWTERDPPTFETISAASAHLRRTLTGQRVLLVVDDAWRPEDVTPFQGLGPGAALLLTTRTRLTLPAGSVSVYVDAMEVPQAVRLLGAGLPEGTGVDLRELAERLGEWPLLLTLVNRQMRDLVQNSRLSLEASLREVTEALDAEGPTAFDREDAVSRDQAVARTVGASLRRLSGDEVSRFEQLAIFPEDIPLPVLERLWGLGAFATKKFCCRLQDLSLLLSFNRAAAGTIRLHDVIRAYLLKKGESHLPAWHRRLLDTYRPVSGRWPDLSREETFLWNYLLHHLAGAGQDEACRELLLNMQYLQSKLAATDVNSVLADYSSFVAKDVELRFVHDALRLSAHVLARNPAELAGQLLGRLLDRQEDGIRRLLRDYTGPGGPWLRPRDASLTRPGGALIRTIEHPRNPTALAVLLDGRVVSGSYDGNLRIWDVERGQALQVFKGQTDRVSAIAVLDRHRVIVLSDDLTDDRTLRVWDLENGQALHVPQWHAGRVSGMTVLDSHRVIVLSSDGWLNEWDVESGWHRAFELDRPPIWATVLAVLNGGLVVFACPDNTLKVGHNWGFARGHTLHTLEGHSGKVNAVAVLDSRQIVSASRDSTLRIWDVQSGKTLHVLEGHSGEVNAVAVLDSRQIVSASRDSTLRIWDVQSGKTLHVLEGHSGGVNAVAVLDSRRIVSASDDETLRVWDVQGGQTLHVPEGHSGQITAATLCSRGVISASIDGTLRMWDIESGKTLHVLEGHSEAINAVKALDSRRVVSASSDHTLRVWDVNSGQILHVLKGHSDQVIAVEALDSRRVVSASNDHTLRVWDVDSGQILHVLEGHSNQVIAMEALDSRRVVSASYDDTLRVWDVESGTTLHVFKEDFRVGPVKVLDNRRIVPVPHFFEVFLDRPEANTLRVWDVESRKTLHVLEGHSGGISGVEVLDSRRIVSASNDQTLRLWDMESGQALHVLEGHTGPIYALTVMDSRRVVSASYDETLRVWDVESGQSLRVLGGHSGRVTFMVALDSHRVVFASNKCSLWVGDVESGTITCPFTLEAPLCVLGVTGDSRTVWAGDGKGRFHFFDIVES